MIAEGKAAPAPDAAEGDWVLCVTFTIKPEFHSEFVTIVSRVIDRMRLEDNFVSAVLCRDPEAAGRFFLFETWKSRDLFLAHELPRDYRQPYSARLAEIQADERHFSEWRQIRADYRMPVS